MPKKLFVLGLPKSGTTYLRNLLNAHPSVRLGMEELNKLARRFAADEQDLIVRHYEHLLEHLGMSRSAQVYVGDKILFDNARFMELWLERFVDREVKIITISRDPRDRLVSCRYHILNRERKNIPSAFYPQWEPGIELIWWGDWLPRLKAMGAQEVRYEDLFYHPEFSLHRIFDFLGVPVRGHEIKRLIARARNPWRLSYGVNPYRKGAAGEWKKKLLPEECLKIKARLNHVLFENGWETQPDWEYAVLDSLKWPWYCRGLFRKFRKRCSPEFWEWVNGHRGDRKWLRRWFAAVHDYRDPLMFREYYLLRLLPVPAMMQRLLAKCFAGFKQSFKRT